MDKKNNRKLDSGRGGKEASLFWAGMAVVCCCGLPGSRLYHCRLLCARRCWRYQKVTIAEIGDDGNCWPVFYQSYSWDWLVVV